ncbi:MAG: BamA/OMP85 family outer membrane protein [Bacteroidota bacterium]
MKWLDMVRKLQIGTVGGLLAGCIVVMLLGTPSNSHAQDPLVLVNSDTQVRSIDFRFVGSQTFDPDRLRRRMATQAPTGWDRWKRRLPLLQPTPRLFDPLTFQRDIARLRAFYRNNGFPAPSIDYPATQFNAEENRIRLVITINEGEPLRIQDALFLDAEGERYAVEAFASDMKADWRAFQDETVVEVGSRYTEFKRSQVEDDVARWLRNQGYAFARVTSSVDTDTEARTADLSFFVDPGPQTRIDSIEISGNSSVERRVVERSLPFERGDVFSADALSEGQRNLFNLNLFRVALADVPDQPRDSLVTVRYRVREANMRTLAGEVGYGTAVGMTAEGRWSHRNFFGNARTFTASVVAETGYPDDARFLPAFLAGTGGSTVTERRFRAGVLLREPYIWGPNLSASVEPFGEIRRNPRLPGVSREGIGINETTIGFDTRLSYEILSFRNVTLQHSLQRRRQFVPRELQSGDVTDPEAPLETIGTGGFNRSIFTLSANLGRTDDYVNPSVGFLVRPTAEVAGALIPSGMQYGKLALELTGYQPLTSSTDLAARLFVGRVFPFGESRSALESDPSLRNSVFRNRFNDVLFYAGGGTDLRGWPLNQAGGKFINTTDVDGTTSLLAPIGGTSKAAVNTELRLPFPGLGSEWRTAVFVDAAVLDVNGFSLVPSPPSDTFSRFPTATGELRVGAGAGVRYETPFGFLRFDIAVPLNPDPLDVRDPEDVSDAIRNDRPPTSVSPTFTRQFRLHLGIGRAF